LFSGLNCSAELSFKAGDKPLIVFMIGFVLHIVNNGPRTTYISQGKMLGAKLYAAIGAIGNLGQDRRRLTPGRGFIICRWPFGACFATGGLDLFAQYV
jgi:hypothetical protein